MLGNGTGSFRRAAGSPMAVPGAPSSLQVADLNSDGRLDVAVANSDADSVTVLLGNGAGQVPPGRRLSVLVLRRWSSLPAT